MSHTSMSFNPLDEALQQQRMAIDADAHVWVSASAGTGKTKVLTDRILNLLLNGVNPRKILCITFTNAAAAEMRHRLLDRLGHWATCSDTVLAQELTGFCQKEKQKDVTSEKIQDMTERARTLFVEVLEISGGIRIQTIHSFCQSLLVTFPLEAGLSLDTQLMTEQEQQGILKQVHDHVLKASSHDRQLKEALDTLAEYFHWQTFSQLCDQLLEDPLKLVLALRSGVPSARATLRRLLDLDQKDPLTKIALGNDTSRHLLNQDQWAMLVESVWDGAHILRLKKTGENLVQSQRVTDQKNGKMILDWCVHPEKNLDAFTFYEQVFLTQEGSIRQRLLTQGMQKDFPDLLDTLQDEAERVQTLSFLVKKISVYKVSVCLLTLGQALLEQYEAHKQAQGVLDYDDLILKASSLLHHGELSPWILYKLDGGVDHLLVDEAQDTNMVQWSIIKALTEEFFAGQGARNCPRTLFVVGDGKQSIYSFQGTDPDIFPEMQNHFARLLPTDPQPSLSSHKTWKEISMSLSFRSTATILEFVDLVFSQTKARQGVYSGQSTLKHLCFRQGQAGKVELWPLVTAETPFLNDIHEDPLFAEEEYLFSSSEESSGDGEQSPDAIPSLKTQIILAHKVADQIEQWLNQKTFLPNKNRPLQADDILVLVRTRSVFVPALIRVLKHKGIPVTGLDRLTLLKELCIQDVMALSEFLLLPQNDFALACVLKSPFGNLTEDDLFLLAHSRGEKSLWENLKIHQEKDSRFSALVDQLSLFLSYVDFMPLFRLYSEILFTHGHEARITQRFGAEALDFLEEFLNLAYTYGKQPGSSLQGFLEWLRQGSVCIKRDFSQKEAGQIRIMTVHSAKGLQAPVVILADAASCPLVKPSFFWPPTPEGDLGFVWSPPQKMALPVTKALKEDVRALQDEEYRRLLYVALTRAEDQLYICGAIPSGQTTAPEGSWYDLIETVLKQESMLSPWIQKCVLDWGEGLTLKKDEKEAKTSAKTVRDLGLSKEHQRTDRTDRADPLPEWVWTCPAPEEKQTKIAVTKEAKTGGDQDPLTRQKQESSKIRDSSQGLPQVSPAQKGQLIHKLLEVLPELPKETQHQKIQVLRQEWNRLYGENESHVFQQSVEKVLGIVNNPAFSFLFQGKSAAEIPLMGTYQGKLYTGRIDRLVILDQEVWIVDYKTDDAPPDQAQDLNKAYGRQLELYAQLVQAIYPHHSIRTFILWTETETLTEIN